MLPQAPESFVSHSESDTLARAGWLAEKLVPGDIIGLQGDLGTGKTVFCRGIAQKLGYSGHVTSPSYVLVNEYAAREMIYHIDLYRLSDNADWDEIGLNHYLGGKAICLIEWPQRLGTMGLSFNYMVRFLHLAENSRKIEIISACQGRSSGGEI